MILLPMCSRLTTGLLVLFALFVVASPDTADAGPAVFTVNSANDPGMGGCDAAECTLREAITAVNNIGGPAVIAAIPGLPEITPASTLPFINAIDPITIDGPDDYLNLDCPPPCGINWGLVFTTSPGVTASDITIRNVAVSRFAYDGIQVCGGLENGACLGDVDGVNIDRVAGGINASAAVRILGSQISNVAVTNDTNLNSNGERGLWIESPGPVTNVTLDGLRIPGAGSHGVRIIGGASITGLDILGGRYCSTGGSGLYVQGGTISDVLIDFLLADLNAIDGVTKTMGASIFDVTLDAVGAYNNGSRGIHIDASAGLSQLNVIGSAGSNNGNDGLRARAGLGLSSTTVSGGDFSNNNIGIHVRSDGEMGGIEVENALVENNNATGIVLNQPGSGQGSSSMIHGNTVRQNGRHGIELYGSANSVISRNITYDNDKLGIDLVADTDLADGVTPNDAGDADDGPNGLLNFPVITGADGEFATGTACPTCLVELFMAWTSIAGATEHGEPYELLGTAYADGTGNFAVSICGYFILAGTFITTTATNSEGQTSESSLNYTLPVIPEPCSATPTPTGQSPTPTPTPGPTAGPPTPPAGTATPTPTLLPSQTPTPTPIPTGQPGALTQGDNDCDGDSDAVDALVSLQKNAGFQPNQEGPGCPEIGGAVPAGIVIPLFGDIDCDIDVDAVDALQILRNIAGLPVNQGPGCPAIGEIL